MWQVLASVPPSLHDTIYEYILFRTKICEIVSRQPHQPFEQPGRLRGPITLAQKEEAKDLQERCIGYL